MLFIMEIFLGILLFTFLTQVIIFTFNTFISNPYYWFSEAFIAFDIFDYAMSINNGELRNKIYYRQYNNFDMSNKFHIIGDDVIDRHFIKYFMNDKIEFKANDTKIAFITKILDKLLVKISLNIS